MVWWRHDKRHARGYIPTQGYFGGQGHARRAHHEHVAHGRDAGGVKAQRPVELLRALPAERRACYVGRGVDREAGGRGVVASRAACTEKVRLKAWGPRARAEHTLNMRAMSVTLDVSKLSGWLNFDADCQPKGGHAMRGEVRAAGGGRA